MGTLSSYWAAHQGPNADMEERSSFLFPPSILSLRVGDEQRIQGQLTSVAYLLERLWRKSRGCRDSSALLPTFWRNCKERAEDAGTAQLCCLPFRETVKKLWHCFAAGNMWDATACNHCMHHLLARRGLQQQSPFLIFLSTVQRGALAMHIGSNKVQWIGQLWGAVIQRDTAGKQRLKLGSEFLQFLLAWVSSYIHW